MNEKDIQEKLNMLTNIRIPMAEFEYLYDPDITKEGQIDPNALSAGGFPFCLSMGILQRLYESYKTIKPATTTPEHKYLLEQLEKYVTETYDIKASDLSELITQLADSLIAIFCGKIAKDTVDTIFTELRLNPPDKKAVDPKYRINDKTLLKKLFEDEFTLAFVSSNLWILHKQCLIQSFYEVLSHGGSIGTFDTEALRTVDDYINTYIDGMRLNEPAFMSTGVVSDYKVFWEADLGYILKYKLEKANPNLVVNVWIDLHAKTGLFSLKPFKAHISLLSLEQQAKAYSFIRSVKANTDAVNDQPYLKQAVTTEGTLTNYYNQYAYLFETYPKDKIDFSKPCDQTMYLASLLNAKAALFRIYDVMESSETAKVARPKTKIFRTNTIDSLELKEIANLDKVVLKEGGKCSTGGSEVSIITPSDMQTPLRSGYTVTVTQSYIPSYIFKYNGRPVHTHCRKLSVLNSTGKPVHLGFNFKISYRKDNDNSSSYATIPLFFNEQGNFLFGVKIGKKSQYFTKLSDVGLELAISDKELSQFLVRVRLNWLLAIYYLNKYFDNDFTGMCKKLINERYVDSIYDIPAMDIA